MKCLPLTPLKRALQLLLNFSGIGSYAGDHPVYRYSSYLPEEAKDASIRVSPKAGDIAEGVIHSMTLSSGEQLYYAASAEGRYIVDSDGERAGGVFHPATTLLATDTALYFGTEEGAVGCFNTDKRGLAMYRPIQSDRYILTADGYLPLSGAFPKLFSEDMLTEETVYEKQGDSYIAEGVRKIFIDGGTACLVSPLQEYEPHGRMHRYYYSHSGHAYTASCVLAMDDGGLPQYAKDTVSRSATIKVKCPEGSSVSVFVRTDRHPFREIDRLSSGSLEAAAFALPRYVPMLSARTAARITMIAITSTISTSVKPFFVF